MHYNAKKQKRIVRVLVILVAFAMIASLIAPIVATMGSY